MGTSMCNYIMYLCILCLVRFAENGRENFRVYVVVKLVRN